MACRLDVKKAILDNAFDEAFEGRYTYTRMSDDTVRINAQVDNVQTKALSRSQAIRIANQKLESIKKSFNNAITGYVTNISEYDPVTITLNVNPSYVEYEYRKLPLDQQTDPADRMFQLPGIELSKASPETIKRIKEFLTSIGVDYQAVNKIAVNGEIIGANGVADITQKLIQVVNGKEASTLPEETMHFVVEIIQQTDPKLFNTLLKEINGYRILNDVFATYSTDPNYQTKEGKPDVIKLKKEAIAKVLAETVINKSEGSIENPENLAKVESWWEKILNYLKGLFLKSGFDIAAMKIISGEEIGSVDDIRNKEAQIYLQQGTRDSIYGRLKDISSKIEKRDDGYYIDGEKVPRRVTDLVKDWYERRFKAKDLTKNEYQTALFDLKAEKGTDGHADLEYAFSLFVNEDGYLRTTPLDDSGYVSRLNPNDRDMYELLRDNLKDRLNSFPKENGGTRFLSEIMVYDAKRGLAGTIDFLAIEPDGKTNILDWKFMDLNVEKYTDVPWYKVNAWRQQMEQYKLLLEKVYGVKPQDFKQTRMIPIKAKYVGGNAKEGILPTLSGIQIGDVNVKNIKEDYLLPVGLEGEKTGNKKVDALLEKLNAVYRKISEKKALPSEKLSKAEQLNALFSAIRQLQIKQNIKPLLYQAKVLNKQLDNLLEQYKTNWKGKDVKSFSQEQISAFYDELETAQNAISHYTTLDTELKFLFKGELSEEDKALREDLRETVDDARGILSELSEVSGEFVENFVAGSEGVDDFLTPEKVIKGITKWFSSTATIPLKALEVLYKKANRAFTYAAQDTVAETKKLMGIKSKYDEWAKGKGLSSKNYFSFIKKEKSNELIDEFNPEFYKTLKKKIGEKDIQWIKDNINVAEYTDFLKEKLKEDLQRVQDKPRVGTDEEIERDIKREIAQIKSLYDTSTIDSAGWYNYDILKKFPDRTTWESNEWKELTKSENKPALDFYNYIKERNEYYQEIGYISKAEARVFLPFVRKGLMEKLVLGGNISFGEQFLRSVSIDEGDVGFGKIDPLTGRPIDTIPTYFTKEIEGELSTDLFRTIALYNEMAIRYKYLRDIEAQGRALINTERNKKAIATSMFGKTVYKDGVLQYTPDNNENAQLIENMVKGIIYGQKFVESESFDQLLGSLSDFGERANKKLGIKIFPENLSGRQISINKVINQLNNTFQLNALGLNPLSALSNLLGGSFQSVINAETYFTKSDFISSQLFLTAGKMTGGEDQKKFIGALEYFLPLTESYNKELAKHLSISKLSQENIQEFLMILMRKSDMLVQTANFRSFLINTIVDGDRVVNARQYLKEQPEYQDMFAGTQEERKARKEKFEDDVKKLIEEKGVLKLAEIKDGELVIPGVDKKHESVVELRRKVQQLSKDALGNLSEDDLRMINLNIYGKSFMLFKNWIPRLVDVRLGNLKYNSASDAYEWGRMRNVFRIMSEDVLGSVSNLINSLQGNDKGVDFMRQLYEKKKADYETDTGKELKMTESEFMSLVQKNIKAQLVDVIFMLTLFALYLGLKANAPEDDEDEVVKNQYKFMLRAVDKVKDELAYFYDPTSFTTLVSSGIFPSISYLNNFKKLLMNFGTEMYGLGVGDEELVEKTKVIKYLMKSFPVSNQAAGMLPMFYPELAKDLGIRAQSQARPVTL